MIIRKCINCDHSKGLGFDSWCELGFTHTLYGITDCLCFKKIDVNFSRYTHIEFEDNKIILWKGKKGFIFTHREFINFLNEMIYKNDDVYKSGDKND